MYRITVTDHFDAAHYLRGYVGKCADLHGHRWTYTVTVKGKTLDKQGIVIDFTLLKSIVRKETERYDHQELNKIPPFDMLNPTAEFLAQVIFTNIHAHLEKLKVWVTLDNVTVWETPTSSCSFTIDEEE